MLSLQGLTAGGGSTASVGYLIWHGLFSLSWNSESVQTSLPATLFFSCFPSLPSLCAHTLAWSHIVFLCCTVSQEQSPLQIIKHFHVFPVIFEISPFQDILLTLCVCVCVCVCAGTRAHAHSRKFKGCFDCVLNFYFVMGCAPLWRNSAWKSTLLVLSFVTYYCWLYALGHTHVYLKVNLKLATMFVAAL